MYTYVSTQTYLLHVYRVHTSIFSYGLRTGTKGQAQVLPGSRCDGVHEGRHRQPRAQGEREHFGHGRAADVVEALPALGWAATVRGGGRA